MISLITQYNRHEEKEEGFTLIELLVVILIIGILSAIAIPVFLNQRKSAHDASAKSDLRNAIIATETYFVKNPKATQVDLVAIKKMMKKDSQVRMTWTGKHSDYCIEVQHINSDVMGTNWLFSSKEGGSPIKASQNAMSCSNYGANTFDTHVVWNVGEE